MSTDELVLALESAYGKELDANQAAIYRSKLSRFSESQLSSIFDKVLEQSKYFPKVADLFGAATDLGHLAAPFKTANQPHTWSETNCKLCHGEGRLAAFFEVFIKKIDGVAEKRKRVSAIYPLSSRAASSHKPSLQELEYEYVFRCSCGAGEAQTIPRAWPKWQRSEEA